MNRYLMEKLSIYLNECPDYIDADLINQVNDQNILTNEETVRIIMKEIMELKNDGYLKYMFQELNINDYLNNPYLQNIKLDNIKGKNWEIKNLCYQPFELFVYDDLKNINNHIIPSVGFFKDIYNYPAILEKNRIWMLITPNEINTMKEPINNSFGNVLTIGLGMGYFAYMASLKNNVQSITIIESDEEVINIFKQYILPQFENKDKITIIQDDGFHYLKNSKQQYDYVFVDIWHDPSDGCNLYQEFKKLERPGIIYDYWIEKTIKYYLDTI